MRKNQSFVVFSMLMLAFPALHAQDFLQKTKNYLDVGDCENAKKAYNAYKVEHPRGDAEVERRIAECNNIPQTSLNLFESYVYYVKMTKMKFMTEKGTAAYDIIGDDGWEYYFRESEMPIATGFVTSDGYFITARQVVEPWAYINNVDAGDEYVLVLANLLKHYGAVVDATIEAENKAGDRLTFHYTDFTVSGNNDKRKNLDDGFVIYLADGYDYAYSKINTYSNIESNAPMLRTITAGTRLEILGFPFDNDNRKNGIRPQSSYATASNNGLINGLISVTDLNYESGSIGGPVFCKYGDKNYLVGMVSAKGKSHDGSSRILPISEVRYTPHPINTSKDLSFKIGNLTFKMVYVEGGTFQMGSHDGKDDEKPAHSVTVSDFYMGEFEVTQELWQEVMGTTIYQQRDKTNTSFSMYGVGADYPMYYVHHIDAEEFCGRLNQRLRGQLPDNYSFALPTEAEWEYAARGGGKSNAYTYAGSNYLSDAGWNTDNSNGNTHAVGLKKANELGLYDMSGNVWEWCADWYGEYSGSLQTNPRGPSSGLYYVIRGGSWHDLSMNCRVSNRGSAPAYRCVNGGFRLALVRR